MTQDNGTCPGFHPGVREKGVNLGIQGPGRGKKVQLVLHFREIILAAVREEAFESKCGCREARWKVCGGLVVEVREEGRLQRRQDTVKSDSRVLLSSLLWSHLYCVKNSVSDLALPLPPRTCCLYLATVGAQ